MTIFGHDFEGEDKGQPISFRIWDASTGTTYTDARLTDYNGTAIVAKFASDALIGNFDEPSMWTPSGHVEQNVPMSENWNWISLGVDPVNGYPEYVFSDYKHWRMHVKPQIGKSAYCEDVEWSTGLTISANTMYKVKITRTDKSGDLPSQLVVTGTPVILGQTYVQLQKGWNWLPYTPLVTMTINEALAGANPKKGDFIKSQSAIAIYSNGSWEGNLKVLESGRGYVYYSTDANNKQFVYPDVSTSSKSRMLAPLSSEISNLIFFNPVDWHLYPDNMTMVIQLLDGETVVDTCELAAFVNDECRGATRIDDGLYYLVIAGEGNGNGQPVDIRTNINGEIISIDQSQKYVSDANIGTPWEPYVIDLNNRQSGIRAVIVKDDDTDWYSIQGYKIGHKPTTPGVYIHNGKKVILNSRGKLTR